MNWAQKLAVCSAFLLIGVVIFSFLLVFEIIDPFQVLCHTEFEISEDKTITKLISDLRIKMKVGPPVLVRIITEKDERAFMNFGAHIEKDKKSGVLYICAGQFLVKNSSPAELEAILAHELGHYRAGHTEKRSMNTDEKQAEADVWAIRTVGRDILLRAVRNHLRARMEYDLERYMKLRIELADKAHRELLPSQ
jgi:hypothetical protein